MIRCFLPGIVVALLAVGCAAPQAPPAVSSMSRASESGPRGPTPDTPLAALSIQSWGSAQGLVSENIQAFAFTPDGYLWLGTDEGLARFDGLEFTFYDGNSVGAFRANSVSSLQTAPDGGLWIGTMDGLIRYDDGQFRRIAAVSMPEGVRALALGAEASLWVVGNGGVRHLDREGRVREFTRAMGLPSEQALGVHVDAQGTAWVAMVGGLVRIDAGGLRVWTTADGLPGETVHAVTGAADGLWVGTSAGLAHVSAAGTRVVAPEQLRDTYVDALLRDDHGTLWIGTRNAGLYRLRADALSRLTVRDGLASNVVSTLAVDEQGNLWLGGYVGVQRLSAGAFRTFGRAEGLADDQTWTVLQARDGTMWFGSNGGLDAWRDGRVVRHLGQADGLGRPVLALAEDRTGALWIGTHGGGVRRLVGASISAVTRADGLPHEDVRTIFEDRHGDVWIGTNGGGLARRRGSRLQAYGRDDGLASLFVHALQETRDGTLLVGLGGSGGLCTWREPRFECRTTRDGLEGAVYDIHEATDGTLWLATNSGLQRVRAGRVDRLDVTRGLSTNVVWAVVDDRAGNFWVTSNRGVARLARADVEAVLDGRSERIRPLVFGLGNGLRSLSFSGAVAPTHWTDTAGRLWFATSRGAVMTELQARSILTTPPRVLIESVRGRDVTLYPPGGGLGPRPVTLRFGPGEDRLSLHFSAPDLTWPERLYVQYRLDGVDSRWIAAERDLLATYGRVPPGPHVFRVRALDRQSGVDGPETRIAIVLEPHLHETTWFRATAAGLLVVGLLAAWRVRDRAQRQRQDALAREAEAARQQVRTLRGLIPVCSWCRKVRADDAGWQQLEDYVSRHTDAVFSHGICPHCSAQHFPTPTDPPEA